MPDAKNYEPELGQAVFGQPWQRHPVSELVKAALLAIDDELQVVMWNRNQEEYNSPFSNTGNRFECPTFSAHAYSWDFDASQEWNFKWRDVRISWYKYLGRGMSANMEIAPELAAEMLADCLRAVRELDPDRVDKTSGGGKP